MEMSPAEFARSPDWKAPPPPIKVCRQTLAFNRDGSLSLSRGDKITRETVQAIADRWAEVMAETAIDKPESEKP